MKAFPQQGKFMWTSLCGFPSHGFFTGDGITKSLEDGLPGVQKNWFKFSRLVLGEHFYNEPKWNSKNECSQTLWRGTYGSTFHASGFTLGLYWIPFTFVFPIHTTFILRQSSSILLVRASAKHMISLLLWSMIENLGQIIQLATSIAFYSITIRSLNAYPK